MLLNSTVRSSGLLRKCFLMQSKPLLRTIKLIPTRKPLYLDKSEFKIIYDFPYVNLISAVLKSKTSISIAAAVSSAVLFCFEEIRSAAYITILSGAGYYCSCILATKLGAGVVGKIYVNKEGDITNVIISSVDPFGRRIDRIHKVDDICNVDFPNKLYQSLGFGKIIIQNSDIEYKINRVNCKYIDKLMFDSLFDFKTDVTFNDEDGDSKRKITES